MSSAHVRVGTDPLEGRVAVLLPLREIERVKRDAVAGAAQSVRDVLDRRVVAGERGCTVAAARNRDVLERSLVLENAVEGHAATQIAGADLVDGRGHGSEEQGRCKRSDHGS